MANQTIPVPDIGGAEGVEVIELCVSVGDTVAVDDSLIVLESDKASMDIPSPVAGKIVAFRVGEGDKVSEGDIFAEIEVEGAAAEPASDDSSQANVAEPVASSAPASAANTADAPVLVPDIGGAEGVDVIEVCVAVGDQVSEGDSLIVLESDKASMEIPAPASGEVVSLSIAEGDKVSEGDAILVLKGEASTESTSTESVSASAEPAVEPVGAAGAASELPVSVPDIGGAEGVDVIEVCVAVGDEINEGDALIVLESDKASMEVPSPASGKLIKLNISEGDKVSQGSPVGVLEVVGAAPAAPAPAASEPVAPAPQVKSSRPQPTSEKLPQEIQSPGSEVYAGPAVRKLARQLGVDLTAVKASGPKGRLSKDDVKNHVKAIMQGKKAAPSSAAGSLSGSGIPAVPAVDFSKFGEIEKVKMTKIHKVTAANMTRNWLNVPHVTQFDDADITDLEAFRKDMKAQAEKAGVKLTPLPFLLKACAAALKYEPSFNVSLDADGEHIIKKNYVHIGIAVASPNGLTVPVIRDVDKKGLFELAEESITLAKKAREGKLLPKDMQGGCFTISSLGPIGGTGFTPIVNAPEVAILGVSKAAIKPVWNGSEFEPRNMLPLCLSYDHRAINGADAGNFLTYLTSVLADLRKLLV